MLDFRACVIKHLTKIKIVHKIPGRIRFKSNNFIKVPNECKEYDGLVTDGIKLLNGIDSVEYNYITGTMLICYDVNKVYEEKVIKWINLVIKTVIDNFKLIEEYAPLNLEYVVSTMEQKLKEAVKLI